MAQQDGDDERSARQAQLDGLGNAGETDRQRAENDTHHDAQEDGDEVRFVQGAAGVAHFLGKAVDMLLRTYADQAIAHLDVQIRARDQLDPGADDTGDTHLIDTPEMQVFQFLARQGGFGDRHAAGHQVMVLFHPVGNMHGHFLAKEDADLVHFLLRSHDQHLVALVEDRIAGREDDFVPFHDAGDDEIGLELMQDIVQFLAEDGRVLHGDMHPPGLAGIVFMRL